MLLRICNLRLMTHLQRLSLTTEPAQPRIFSVGPFGGANSQLQNLPTTDLQVCAENCAVPPANRSEVRDPAASAVPVALTGTTFIEGNNVISFVAGE